MLNSRDFGFVKNSSAKSNLTTYATPGVNPAMV
jgi:hypothetical protein